MQPSTGSQMLAGGVVAGGRWNGALGKVIRFSHGRGARLWDIDGNEYLDFSSSSGASMLGYGVPEVDEAVSRALAMGTLCTYETTYHLELAELLGETLPGAERIRLVNTGGEATMAALRLARHATGREKVLKFDGHFHGMHELLWFDAQQGDGRREDFAPGSAGMPPSFASHIVIAPFNDEMAFLARLSDHGHELAAVIMEPISYNLGCVPADPRFIRRVREETERRGIVLIFDEVLSGFRMGPGGAQEHYGVTADLACWAKALGAGWPIAALTGRAAIMDALNPTGPVVVSGTYSGHPAAVLASIAALRLMLAPGFYEGLNARSNRFYQALQSACDDADYPARVQGIGARYGIYFGNREQVVDANGARRSSRSAAEAFVRGAWSRGLYFHDFGSRSVPMHYGLTSAHTQDDLDGAVERLAEVIGDLPVLS